MAYAVEITGLQDGKVMGNLYELDYRQHAAKLEQQALPVQEVSLKFEDGTEGRYPCEQYNHGIYGMVAEHGKVVLPGLGLCSQMAKRYRQRKTRARRCPGLFLNLKFNLKLPL